ncbi:YodL domain-containing protein [Lacrimispora sp.]|uniref:YodL domain-containing protein n=1 Tax=Lacrimispora sp. TaxID=2719234 RepID=UPI0028AD9858|nr:YodL domain-containing protein [Lacrimispora sp.]
MPGIMLQNGLISYYGNPAGYTEKNQAVVDRIFQSEEMDQWLKGRGLTPRWTEGVMERILSGERQGGEEYATPLKNVRIWQLCPEVDVRMKFISYVDMVEQFGPPVQEDYCIAYDGQPGTNDLETIYERFSNGQPSGYCGNPLSMSDVIELYEQNGSEFYYIDRKTFKSIDFEKKEQQLNMNMGI